MAIPYRLFNRFRAATLRGQSANNSFNTVDKWTNDHLINGEFGKIKNMTGGGGIWNEWVSIFRGYDEDDFESHPGMDELCRIEFSAFVGSPLYNSKPITQIVVVDGILGSPTAPNSWDKYLVTGKYYDGTNPYNVYPPDIIYAMTEILYLNVVDLPALVTLNSPAWNLGIGVHTNSQQANWWRNGYGIRYADATPNEGGWAADNGFRCVFTPNSAKVMFFNAVCNSLSRYSMTTAGGVPVVLTGLGFNNSDAEIGWKPGGWNDYVAYIYFEGLQGQGTYTLRPTVNYTINSTTQITINSMPAMLAGTYRIKLRKDFHGTGKTIDSYAGDWRCDTDGRVYPGQRIIFTVADDGDGDGEEDPVIYIEWPWKSRTTTIFKYWAPIDVRTPLIFYDGRILDIGSFERAPSDISGLAQVSDLTLEIANHDQEISKLLAEYECLNQTVSFWWGFRNSPYATKSYLCSMVVADYEKPDSTWKVTLRDINSRYF